MQFIFLTLFPGDRDFACSLESTVPDTMACVVIWLAYQPFGATPA